MNDDVTRYYDANTRGFIRFGRGGRSTGAIHRALNAPGVTTQEDALHYVHRQILEILGSEGIVDPGRTAVDRKAATVPSGEGPPSGGDLPRIVDLGCGIGGSIRWFLSRLAADFAGLTLSRVQAETAKELLAEVVTPTPTTRARVFHGSFNDEAAIDAIADWLGEADAVYMIESYNHGSSAGDTLTQARRLLRPGGTLIIVDDLPTDTLRAGTAIDPRISRWRDEFVRGWHVHTFESETSLREAAATVGFTHRVTVDMSTYVVVDRLRDRLIRLVAGPARLVGASSEWWDNIRGGNALQQLEKAGYMEYKLIVFRNDG